jgi:hypothetical protein
MQSSDSAQIQSFRSIQKQESEPIHESSWVAFTMGAFGVALLGIIALISAIVR